jgi:hypothetical protein
VAAAGSGRRGIVNFENVDLCIFEFGNCRPFVVDRPDRGLCQCKSSLNLNLLLLESDYRNFENIFEDTAAHRCELDLQGERFVAARDRVSSAGLFVPSSANAVLSRSFHGRASMVVRHNRAFDRTSRSRDLKRD